MDRQLHTDNDAPPPRDGHDALEPRSVTFSITELAEEFGLTTRAIRFYEDKGLLSPERRGQVRIYHPRDRARLILIVRGKNVGLALAEIKEILSLYDLRDGCETQNQVAVDKFRKRISLLREQRTKAAPVSRRISPVRPKRRARLRRRHNLSRKRLPKQPGKPQRRGRPKRLSSEAQCTPATRARTNRPEETDAKLQSTAA